MGNLTVFAEFDISFYCLSLLKSKPVKMVDAFDGFLDAQFFVSGDHCHEFVEFGQFAEEHFVFEQDGIFIYSDEFVFVVAVFRSFSELEKPQRQTKEIIRDVQKKNRYDNKADSHNEEFNVQFGLEVKENQ